MDCGWPGSSVLGILQARILEWVAVSSSIPLRNEPQKNSAQKGPEAGRCFPIPNFCFCFEKKEEIFV